VAAADGTVALTPAVDPSGAAAHVFRGEAMAAVLEGDRVLLKKVPLTWTSFAEAGASGSEIAVWLPLPERLQAVPVSPFHLGKESYSRAGNLDGSIADGDPATVRVTFDGTRRGEDWFAVERSSPVTINTVVFVHGHVFHDGGWWDASQGKPRIQVKKTADGPWEDLAAIDSYPATTAADARSLQDGKEFVVRVPPIKVLGVRVIGVPACGDSPKQNFASCGEIDAFMDKKQ
jgi:hypothetical protein